MNKISATVTILTYNSEKTLEACLASVKDFAEILVLDGGSTDRTRDIAASFGARIESQSETPGPISNYTDVRVRSFELASHDWIFWIDSDEIADGELVASMSDAALQNDPFRAFRVPAFPVLEGKMIRYAYFMPLSYIRFVNRKMAHWSLAKRVHEHVDFDPGVKVELLRGTLLMPWSTLEEYRIKDKKYIAMAFSRPVLNRPSVITAVRSIAKNFTLMCWILLYGAFASIRYGRRGLVMPWEYHVRFARYHLAIIRERIRQFVYGTSYVPPSAA